MAAATLTPGTAVNSSFAPVSIQYENCSSAIVSDLGFSSVYIINLILGLPLNLYIVWFITVGSVSDIASELSSFNLSLYEIIVISTSVPTILILLNTVEICSYCFLAYEVKLFSILFNLGRPLFQCCVCVERYVAVIHPLTFIKYKALRYRLAFSAVTWTLLLGTCLSNLFFVQNIYWVYYAMLPYYFILFLIQACCCVAVLRVLRQPGPGGGVRDSGVNHMKKKAFRLMMILLVTIVLNWCPMIFLIIIYTVLSDTDKIKGTHTVFFSMILTGFVHPLLYLHRCGKLPFYPKLIIQD